MFNPYCLQIKTDLLFRPTPSASAAVPLPGAGRRGQGRGGGAARPAPGPAVRGPGGGDEGWAAPVGGQPGTSAGKRHFGAGLRREDPWG